MFTILNRLRGMNGVWSKFNGLLLALVVQIAFNNPYVSIAVGLGYIIGESFGWGDWVGTVSERGIKTIPKPYEEGKSNYIQWLATKLIDPTKDWINHCRIALIIRGFYWWVCLLPFVFFIEWYYVLTAILFLSLAFPIACEFGYRTTKLFNFKHMTGGWEHQEVWYGLFQDVVILILLLGI